MIKKIFCLTYLSILLLNCSSLQKIFTKDRDDFLFSYRYKETQVFFIHADKDAKIRGEEGTIIHIPLGSLLGEDGKPLAGEIRIELAEYYTNADILLSGLSTTSGEKAIETKGMIRLEAYSSEGKKAKINKRNPLSVEFKNSPEPGYEIFYGKKKEDGSIDWTNDSLGWNSNISFAPSKAKAQTTMRDSESVIVVSELRRVGFSILNFGWINCDRFLNFSPIIPLYLNVLEEEILKKNIEERPIFLLIFKDINSMMPVYMEYNKRVLYFPNLPPGKKATVIGWKKSGETRWLYWKKDIVIGEEDNLNPEWTSHTAKQLAKLLKEIKPEEPEKK
ncbi:hypothetical protein [Leptospira andrefontaineae]|uniref:Uncharacterized protein n=1 Tax=Leptospira andrefontaineae TaxID=2484976 RepID=A0A4R9GXH4_9LEPT|nr:hypothetical protein [Leptospira andrefontaineae]TGK35380.1 hypothetical protein EHO65_19720 [Leptospira andrefontaineae]